MAAAAPEETAVLVDRFRKLVPQLPTTYCRRRLVDLELLRKDLANDKSFVCKQLSQEERDGLLRERAAMAFACLFKPDAAPTAPYLYNPKSFAQGEGGPYERAGAMA